MNSDKDQTATIDDYIKSFPQEVQEKLNSLKKLVREEIPNAEEVISYGVPTFKLNGTYVVYFAGYKKHISIYPAQDAIEKELPEIAQYRTGKGTLQFPLDKQLPLPLIRKIVKVMLQENKRRTGKS